MRLERSWQQPRRSSALRSARWHAYAKPSMMPIVASILTIALCFTACATSRKESSRAETLAQGAYADSLIRELRRQEAVTVPQSEVVLKLPVEDIRSLPRGAEFRDRSGQASAAVQFSGDTVYVFATCDSLQRMCSYYEQKYEIYKTGHENLMELQESEVEVEPPDVVRVFFQGILAGVLLTIATIIFIKLKTKLL